MVTRRPKLCWIIAAVLGLMPYATAATGRKAAREGLEDLDRHYTTRKEGAGALRLRVHLLVLAGERDSAERVVETARGLREQYLDVRLQWIMRRAGVSRARQFRELLDLSRQQSKSPSVLTELALFAEVAGADSLRAAFRSAVANEPAWVPALLHMVRLESRSEFWLAKALDVFERKSAEATAALSGFLGAAAPKGVPLAKQALDKVAGSPKAESEPAASVRVRLIAALHYHCGHAGQAIRNYTWYIEMRKGLPEPFRSVRIPAVYCRLSRVYAETGKPEESSRMLEQGLHLYPRSAILLVEKARRLLEAKKKGEAKAMLERSTASSPEYPFAHLLLARVHSDEGKIDATVQACGAALGFSHRWTQQNEFLEQVAACLAKLARHPDQQAAPAPGKH